MTDSQWPERGAANRPKGDESKGFWFRCLKSLGIRHESFTARVTPLSRGLCPKAPTWKGLPSTRNLGADDRVELR